MRSESEKHIIVSVCILTYNHEQYIRQCLEGIMMQKTDFSFEILIHDDASTDKTADIICEYEKKYPNIIKPIYQRENQYLKVSSISVTYQFPRAKGKYIAICEGDDYWTDPYKLQKQVDFMEANPDYSLVYHRVKIFDENSKTFGPEENNKSEEEETYEVGDIAKRNFIHTPSVLFRKESVNFSAFESSGVIALDYSLWMLCAENGKIKYFPDIMAVYRVWSGSVWGTRSLLYRIPKMMDVLSSLIDYFYNNVKVYSLLHVQLNNLYKELYSACINNNDNKEKDVLSKLTLIFLEKYSAFQYFLFRYLSVMNAKKRLRFNYFFFLLKRGRLDSFRLIKWCFV